MGTRAEPTEFTEFARRMEPRLRYALAARLSPEVAREATQEALVFAWTHWDRVQSMDNPGGYLYTVAKRWGWRQEMSQKPLPLREVALEDSPPGEPALPAALNLLSAMQRQTVYLVEGLGMSQGEVASLLGVGRTTVQKHLERALSHLRKQLGVTIDE